MQDDITINATEQEHFTEPELRQPPANSSPRIFTKANLPYFAILIATTFMALFPSLTAGFVDWDDPANVLENKLLADGLSWQSLRAIFTSAVNDNYNPLTIFTFALEKHFFAHDPVAAPFIFHFTNLWMHVVCTILVFVLFIKLGADAKAAFIGALFFGIHPMRVESVAWVSERKDVLYGMFYLGAIICYINHTRATEKSKNWYATAVVFALLACLSKLQAVSLPLSMIAIDYYTGRNWRSEKVMVWDKLAFWILSLVFGLGTLLFLSREGYLTPVVQLTDYNFIDKLALSAYSYAIFLVKWIYPYKMTYYYDIPLHVPFIAYALVIAIPLAVGAFLVWAVRRNHTFLVFGLAFFTANVVFLLQVIPLGTGFMADRITYIAYLGLFFIVAKVYQRLSEKFPDKAAGMNGILACYFLLFAFVTYSQARVWKNTLTLSEHHISTYPKSYYGYNQLGSYYFKLYVSATDDKKLAMLQNAQHYFLAANKADSIDGRPFPTVSADIIQSIGVIYGLTGEQDLAISYFSSAVSLIPESIEPVTNRAYQYFLDKKFVLAIADYNKAIALKPENDDLYYLRANCYYSKGDLANAKKDLDKAISLNDKDPNTFIARSVIYRAENNLTEARNDAHMAQKLGGNVPAMYFE